MGEFSIGDVAARTGVAEGTLRMWERRHGFPAPARLASGHRRYSDADLEAVRSILAERAAGTVLSVAIEHARSPAQPTSLYAWLRRNHAQLESQRLPKRVLIALSHAIEDECLARAERPLLFASFQRERFYRPQEARWREFARSSELACVFADFERVRTPRGGPTEIPIASDGPFTREWAIVCDAPGYGVCLVGWEAPYLVGGSAPRFFESLWSVEPAVVRGAARTCAAMAQEALADPLGPARARLDAPARQATDEQLRLATAISSRALAYLPERGAHGGS